jgi:hypothetical protein
MMQLTVYCRRWGHPHSLFVEITDAGWYINFMLIRGECDSMGHPYLFRILDHDDINYPADLGGYMEYLWRKARAKKWTERQVQPKLNILGRWISKTEESSPKSIWTEYD